MEGGSVTLCVASFMANFHGVSLPSPQPPVKHPGSSPVDHGHDVPVCPALSLSRLPQDVQLCPGCADWEGVSMCVLVAGRMYTYAHTWATMCTACRHINSLLNVCPQTREGTMSWVHSRPAPYMSLSAIGVASSAFVPRFVPHARVGRGNTRAHKAHAHA